MNIINRVIYDGNDLDKIVEDMVSRKIEKLSKIDFQGIDITFYFDGYATDIIQGDALQITFAPKGNIEIDVQIAKALRDPSDYDF